MGPEFSAWLITSSEHGLHKQGKLQVKWRWRMTSIWISSVWVVQESGFVLTINQPRGGILGSQALPLSYYPTHPQTVPTCILFEIRLLVHGRSRIQSQEKRFSAFWEICNAYCCTVGWLVPCCWLSIWRGIDSRSQPSIVCISCNLNNCQGRLSSHQY